MSYLLKFPLSRLSGCAFLLLLLSCVSTPIRAQTPTSPAPPRNDSCYDSGASGACGTGEAASAHFHE